MLRRRPSRRRRTCPPPRNRLARLRGELLEPRLALSAVSFANDQMIISGSSGNDVIDVSYQASQQVMSVIVNGVSETIPVGWGFTPGFSTIVIRGLDGDDSILLRSDPDPAKNIIIEGGAGNDKIRIDPSVGRFASLNAPTLQIDGGTGENSLVIFDDLSTDTGDYVIHGDVFVKLSGKTLVSYESITNATFHTNAQSTVIRVGGIGPGQNVTIFDNGGADQVRIGEERGSRLGETQGTFIYHPGSGPIIDTVVFYDQDTLEPVDYNITYDSTSAISRLNRGWLSWAFGPGVANYVLNGNDLGSTYSVDATAPGSTWTFHAGAGNDKLHVAPPGAFSPVFGFLTGGLLSAIQGNLEFRGGAGTDEVLISDIKESTARHFHVHADRVEAQMRVPTGFDIVPTIRYFDAEAVEVAAGTGGDAFTVHSMAVATPLRLFGNDGDDSFTVSNGDLLSTLRANLQIDGGAGSNSLRLRDQLATVEGGYFFDTYTDTVGVERATFRKLTIGPGPIIPFVYQTGLLTARGLSGWWFEGSPLDDTFHVIATLPEAEVRLDGNNGIDTFRVNAPRHRSSLDIRGGNPTTAPGDSLYVVGNGSDEGSYTPGVNSNSGRVTVNGTLIRFSGLEPVYVEQFRSMEFITPRSKDEVSIVPELNADGTWMKIQGTSGVQNIAFESLSVRQTPTVTINAFINDLVSSLFDPTPDPRDRISINPGAMRGHGVDELTLILGLGDLISDGTLYDPHPAETRLKLIAAAPTVTHDFFGWGPPRASLSTEPGGRATTQFFDESGEALVYEVESIHVTDVILPWGLSEVSYVGNDVSLTVANSEYRHFALTTNHAVTTWHGFPPHNNLVLQPGGTSSVTIQRLLPEIVLRGTGDVDTLTVVFDIEGLPNHAENLRFEGFDREDALILDGLRVNDVAVDTDYRVDLTRGLDGQLPEIGIGIRGIIGVLMPIVEARITGTREQGLPKVHIDGNAGTSDRLTLLAPQEPAVSGNDGRDKIELLVTTVPEMLVFSQDLFVLPTPGQGLRFDPRLGDGSWRLQTDNLTKNVRTSTSRELGINYPEPDFREVFFTAESTDPGGLTLKPNAGGGGSVEHAFGPDGGQVNIGKWSIGADTKFHELTLVGGDIRTTYAGGRYTEPLRLTQQLTGSTSVVNITSGEFASDFDLHVIGALSDKNRSSLLLRDVKFEGDVSIRVTTPPGGSMVSTQFVIAIIAKTFQTRMDGGGETLILQGRSDNRIDTRALTRVEGSGGHKTLYSVAYDGASPRTLLARAFDLASPDPDARAKLEELINGGLGPEIDVVGAPLPGEDPGRTVEISGTGVFVLVAGDGTSGGTLVQPDVASLDAAVDGNVITDRSLPTQTYLDDVQPIVENTDTSASSLYVGRLWTALAIPYPEASFVYQLSQVNVGDNQFFEIVDDKLFIRQGTVIDFEVKPEYWVGVTATAADGPSIESGYLLRVIDMLEVESIVVGDGTAQRSRVEQVTVAFDGETNLASGAFAVDRRGAGGGSVDIESISTEVVAGRTVATLRFGGALTQFGSLVDGNYVLRIDGTKVSRPGGELLDADRNGTGGGEQLYGNQATDNFFRLFGDGNGDRSVDFADFGLFGTAFGLPGDTFDFNGDGFVDFADFGDFGRRFGVTQNFE